MNLFVTGLKHAVTPALPFSWYENWRQWKHISNIWVSTINRPILTSFLKCLKLPTSFSCRVECCYHSTPKLPWCQPNLKMLFKCFSVQCSQYRYKNYLLFDLFAFSRCASPLYFRGKRRIRVNILMREPLLFRNSPGWRFLNSKGSRKSRNNLTQLKKCWLTSSRVKCLRKDYFREYPMRIGKKKTKQNKCCGGSFVVSFVAHFSNTTNFRFLLWLI